MSRREIIVEFNEKYKGIQIVGIFIKGSHRCGYVCMPKSHEYFGKEYDDIPVDCHGGLTYGEIEDGGTYPVVFRGNTHWIGFDCAHSGDKVLSCPSLGGILRSRTYVKNECKGIVDQLLSTADRTKQPQ